MELFADVDNAEDISETFNIGQYQNGTVQYTEPSDEYITFSLGTGADWTSIVEVKNKNDVRIAMIRNPVSTWQIISLPIRKGSTISVTITNYRALTVSRIPMFTA